MNNSYYQVDICYTFEANSDKEAIKKFLETLTAADIPLSCSCLKRFKRGTIGDFGTIICPKDEEYD